MQNAAESILDYLVAEHTLHNNTEFQKIAGSILTASIMLFIIELDSVKWKEHNDECFYPLFVWTANVLLFGDNPRALDLTRKVSRVAMEDLKDRIHFWARACAKYTCKMLMCSLCCHKFVLLEGKVTVSLEWEHQQQRNHGFGSIIILSELG